jgi:hypothetical protein
MYNTTTLNRIFELDYNVDILESNVETYKQARMNIVIKNLNMPLSSDLLNAINRLHTEDDKPTQLMRLLLSSVAMKLYVEIDNQKYNLSVLPPADFNSNGVRWNFDIMRWNFIRNDVRRVLAITVRAHLFSDYNDIGRRIQEYLTEETHDKQNDLLFDIITLLSKLAQKSTSLQSTLYNIETLFKDIDLDEPLTADKCELMREMLLKIKTALNDSIHSFYSHCNNGNKYIKNGDHIATNRRETNNSGFKIGGCGSYRGRGGGSYRGGRGNTHNYNRGRGRGVY